MPLSRSRVKRDQRRGGSGRPDFLLIVLLAILIVFGIVMISSATVVMSKTVAKKDNSFFFAQLVSAGIGFVLLYVLSKIDYRFWNKVATPLMVLTTIALLAVFIPGVGFEHNGATRWINFFGFQFQPSEAMKLTIIIFLASWFEKKGTMIKELWNGTMAFLTIAGLVSGIILILQKDMGTASVIIAISGVMYILAGAQPKHILSSIIGLAGLFWILINIEPFKYRLARLTTFLNPGADTSGAGYQIKQALVAVGSGGLFGLGFGRSRQKFNYLPEAATDSIFAIIAEELGFIGATALVVIILLFVLRGYKIAKGAPDVFSRLVAAGITTWVAAQAFINILAILGLMPLTGVPLPFISYGGTSLIMLMSACGILINISKHAVEGGGNASNRFGRWNWRSYFSGFGGHHRTSKVR